MKKLLALALAIVMVMSLGVTAIAEETPTLKFETESFTEEAQTKEVKLIAENIGKVASLQFAIGYDEEKLELVKITSSDVFTDFMVNSCIGAFIDNELIPEEEVLSAPGEIYVNWLALRAVSIDGVVLTLEFKVISDELGTTNVGFIEGEELLVQNASQDVVDVTVEEESGDIKIDYEHECVWGDWQEALAPGCETEGLEERFCTAYNGTCNKRDTQTVKALDHNWDAGVAQELVCGEKAETLFTCERCGEPKTEYGAVVDHDMGEWNETTAPDCDNDGEETRYCERANCDHKETKPVAKLGHTGGTATCKDKAICERCGEEYGEKNPANHVDEEPVIKGAKEPSCTEKGYTGDKHCAGCDVLLEKGEDIKMKDHVGGTATCTNKAVCDVCGNEYGEIDPANHGSHAKVADPSSAKEPDCKNPGKEANTVCEGCGHIFETGKEIPATGAHGGGVATCTAKAICTGCGDKYGELDPANHGDHKTVLKNEKIATCTEFGYSGDVHCEGCDALIEAGEETPMKPHSAKTVANCQNPAVCAVCGNSYGEVNPDNHVGDTTLKDAKEPTCTEKGYTGDEYCACGELLKKGEEIKEVPHTGGKADCVNKAVCDVCGNEYGEVDETKHVIVEETVKEATCTEAGEVKYHCSVEGCTHDGVRYPEALGHDMGNWVVIEKPTTEKEGLERKDCSRCDHYEERNIKKIVNEPNVIINMNGKTEVETNPNTGAPVAGAYVVVALAAAAAACSKKNHK